MLNIEKYKNELSKDFDTLDCQICALRKKGNCKLGDHCDECRAENIKWLCSEYKEPILDDEEKNKVLSDLFDNISILFCSYDLNKYDFEKKKTIRNNINYARCMEKYFNENNMYSESNSILKEIIVEMISYYANYKEFDTIDISLRGR